MLETQLNLRVVSEILVGLWNDNCLKLLLSYSSNGQRKAFRGILTGLGLDLFCQSYRFTGLLAVRVFTVIEDTIGSHCTSSASILYFLQDIGRIAKIHAVFCIPEILEEVLLLTGTRTLLVSAQRVCRFCTP